MRWWWSAGRPGGREGGRAKRAAGMREGSRCAGGTRGQAGIRVEKFWSRRGIQSKLRGQARGVHRGFGGGLGEHRAQGPCQGSFSPTDLLSWNSAEHLTRTRVPQLRENLSETKGERPSSHDAPNTSPLAEATHTSSAAPGCSLSTRHARSRMKSGTCSSGGRTRPSHLWPSPAATQHAQSAVLSLSSCAHLQGVARVPLAGWGPVGGVLTAQLEASGTLPFLPATVCHSPRALFRTAFGTSFLPELAGSERDVA